MLFVAHLGASEVVEVDIHAGRVVRTIPNLAGVHGVLVVPALHRVYATATNANTMVSLDEDTAWVINKAPTSNYPDGLAYDSRRGAVWTTNESGGTETVIDAGTGAVREPSTSRPSRSRRSTDGVPVSGRPPSCHQVSGKWPSWHQGGHMGATMIIGGERAPRRPAPSTRSPHPGTGASSSALSRAPGPQT